MLYFGIGTTGGVGWSGGNENQSSPRIVLVCYIYH